MKFAHIADTHIRNLKYHSEYRAVFSQLYEKLRSESVDYIIHCGDIAHTKTQISPEFIRMCSDFLKNLADIAPTYVILGNHDGNLRNSNRLDALTPIVDALGHSNLYLLKDSGETRLDEKFTINVLSVFDRENWVVPTSPDRINIALYHGSISGVTTDTGWRMENGENDASIFNNFDYAFLGDIHKTNQILDKKGKVRYPGSTIQQNHGETDDKGLLIWDIEDKDSFKCAHHVLKNPKPFLTIKLTPKGRLPKNLDVPPGARIRLVTNNNLPLSTIRKAIDVVKSRYRPEAVTFLNRAASQRTNIEQATRGLKQEDLRDLAVQENLIKEYLEDFQPEEKTLKKVYESNKRYNALAEQNEEVYRNVNWKLRKLEWDNLFNYGEENSIDFENLEGVIGIFGKNYSGKSSIVDSLLYTIWNTTSKNNRKNLNLINQNKDDCRGYVEIDVGTRTYKIERKSEKYTKKLKGKETLEAKTDVDFDVLDNATGTTSSLNGITRMETDKNIRKIFGTFEDFLTTSMASQLDSLAYLNEGSTRRKEILAKFLDLEFFDRKFKMVKEDSADLKGALKRFSDRDFDLEIKDSRTSLARAETKLSVNERSLSTLEKTRDSVGEKLKEVQEQVDSMPEDVADIKDVKKQLKQFAAATKELEDINELKNKELDNERKFLEKIENFIGSFDIALYNGKKQDLEDHKKRLEKVEIEISQFEEKRKINDDKIDRLKRVPCPHTYQNECTFVADARRSIKKLSHVTVMTNQLTLARKTLNSKIEEMKPEQIDQYIEKYNLILDKKNKHRGQVAELELSIEKNKMKLMRLNSLYTTLKDKEKIYKENKTLIDNFEKISEEKDSLTSDLEEFDEKIDSAKKKVMDLYKTNGSAEQKLEEILSQKNEFCDLESDYTVSDLFMRCMHPNGISYDIIKKRLPVINDEISKILANIVDFEVFFENDEKKLDILIKHPSHDPRPIEMGSGAEKTIASMAIRLALLNVSTLPKGDVFILDEPGTALDAENMEGYVRILDMIKNQFRIVILISHLDGLKDMVERQFFIEKQNGHAHINE